MSNRIKQMIAQVFIAIASFFINPFASKTDAVDDINWVPNLGGIAPPPSPIDYVKAFAFPVVAVVGLVVLSIFLIKKGFKKKGAISKTKNK